MDTFMGPTKMHDDTLQAFEVTPASSSSGKQEKEMEDDRGLCLLQQENCIRTWKQTNKHTHTHTLLDGPRDLPGAPRIMSQVVCIFLAMQLLLLLEALPCEDWEYQINQECCPKCGAGFRVSKNCTINSSTSCAPCSEGTYTDHPNGLTECFRCRVCDTGAHLRVNEKCTYMQNAVCGCIPGYFCKHRSETSCEICAKHTVSPPGYKVTQPGTETSDTKFVLCPHGTFSEAEMSVSCEAWTNCIKEGLIEAQPGSATSNAVCAQKPHNIVLLATIPVLLLFLAVGTALIILWRQRKCSRKGAAGKQKEEQKRDYIPVQESNGPAIPLQETTQNHGEPSYGVHA